MPRRKKALLPRATPPESGWAYRFLARLASLGWEDALTEGRAAALSGAVTSLEIGRTGARADVRAADGQTEETSLSLKPLDSSVRRRVLKAMAARARYAADLLAGRLPEDVESAFQGTRRSLLPLDAGDVVSACTCAEGKEPCAHAGALAVLLGDHLQDDPFLVFLLRGVPREELLQGLQRARTRPERKTEARASDTPRPPTRPNRRSRWRGTSSRGPSSSTGPASRSPRSARRSRPRSTPRRSSRGSARRPSATPRPPGSSSSSTAPSASAPASASPNGSGGRRGDASSPTGSSR